MSIRIAVALAATIGAGIVMSSAAQARPEMVAISGDYAPGTIVVKTHERRLYLILESGRAMRYPVGVGKAGKQWSGTTKIDGKYLNPAWSPPSEVRRDKPNMPDVIPGGSPRNPSMRFTAPTRRARSAASYPTVVSACSTTTSPTSINVYRSERP
jgi:lipoprotein-anchoring transpeptidase ErfK/SrfK